MSIDVPRLLRFGTVGFLVATVYITLYTLLFHAGLTPLTANTVAFTLAVVVQYVGQTCWTFQRQLWDGQQSLRFLATIGFGLIYSGVITAQIGPALEWRPWMSAGLAAVTLPVLNYISFRVWVYRPKPIREGEP